MRRRQFIQLIYDLRAELERSTDPATGVSDLPTLKRAIQRNYESAYDDYDWPHLTMTASTTLNAGQRYYDFPTELDFDKLDEVRLFWSALPTPIERGICLDDYAISDPEADDRSDPALKWDVRFTGTREQMEVWPIPSAPASGDAIRFIGKKKFVQLVNDADLCLIDDHLVILASAVELLPDKAVGKLKTKLGALQARYARVKGRSKNSSGSVRIGLGAPPAPKGVVLRVSG